MISRSLSTSAKRAALHGVAGKLAEFCQALYPLLVAHADDYGRLAGDVFTVKHAIDPASPRRHEDFARALQAMHTVNLIHWYQVDGQQVIEIVKFDAHQDLHKRAKKSIFPESPGNSGAIQESPEVSGFSVLTEEKRTELKGTELKGREGNGTALRAGFERFWAECPKKVGKGEAWKEWEKITPSPEQEQAIVAGMVQQRDNPRWHEEHQRYCPHPSTWLHQGRWEDAPYIRGPSDFVAAKQQVAELFLGDGDDTDGSRRISTSLQPTPARLPRETSRDAGGDRAGGGRGPGVLRSIVGSPAVVGRGRGG